MNIFHLNSSNLRWLANVLGVATLVSFGLLALRGFKPSSSPISSISHSVKTPFDPDSIPAQLKFGSPDVDGKVQVVISMKAEHAVAALGARFRSDVYTDEKINATDRIPVVAVLLENVTLCENATDLRYIVHVSSQPRQQGLRDVLRQTWANPRLFKGDVSRLVFLVGKSADDTDGSIQTLLRSEFERHGDIIQGDFIDTERNGTLKSLMGLRWIADHCPQAAYTVRANDDTFVDIFELLRVMDRHRRTRRVIICPLWKDNTMPILRDPAVCGIWCVKPADFPGRTHFPQYCASVVSVVSRDLVPELVRASATTPFFWISDVFVTGMLTKRVSRSIHYIDLLGSMSLNWNLVEKQYLGVARGSNAPSISITQLDDVVKFHKLWKSVLGRLPASGVKQLSDSVIGQMP